MIRLKMAWHADLFFPEQYRLSELIEDGYSIVCSYTTCANCLWARGVIIFP